MTATVLVTGAGGTTGSALVRLLGDHEVSVRAGVHTPENAPDWGSAVDVVAVDFLDPASLSAAFEGVDRLYLVTPFVPHPAELVEPAVDAAVDAGVEHVVRHSAAGAETEACIPMEWHRAGEKLVEDSGLAYTHLRPTFFMQNLLGQADSLADGAFYNLVGTDVPISHIDARDVARVAATVLTESGHNGAAYELTGPQAVTFGEIAAVLSDALGHDVSHVQLSEADQRRALSEMGMSDALVDGFVDLLQWADGGDADVVTADVEAVTETPATPFETFVSDHRDAFSRSGVSGS